MNIILACKVLEVNHYFSINLRIRLSISLLCFLLFLTKCAPPVSLSQLDFTVNGNVILLQNKDYVGEYSDNELVLVYDSMVEIQWDPPSQEKETDLFWYINGEYKEADRPNFIITIPDSFYNEPFQISLCKKNTDNCISAYILLLERDDKGQNNDVEESTTNVNTDNANPISTAPLVKNPRPTIDNRIQNEAKSPDVRDSMINEIKNTSTEEDRVFDRFGKTGYNAVSARCKAETQKYAKGVFSIRLIPSQDLEFKGCKLIAESQVLADVSIESEGQLLSKLNRRQLLNSIPAEISFAHERVILKKDKAYTLTVRLKDDKIGLEDFSACNSGIQGDKQLKINTLTNSGVFLDIRYNW